MSKAVRRTLSPMSTNAGKPTVVPAPQLGELQEHGFGLFLVRELMDEVAYQADATGNRWKLVKRFPVEA